MLIDDSGEPTNISETPFFASDDLPMSSISCRVESNVIIMSNEIFVGIHCRLL